MQEVALASKCVVFRNGIEIWMPEGEKLEKFQNVLGNLKAHMFINWEGRSMNTADIMGIFSPADMQDMKRRKNGEWVCKKGEWHLRNQECLCHDKREEWRMPDYIESADDYKQFDPAAKARGEAKLAEMRGKVGKKM